MCGIFPPWVYCYHGIRLLVYALSCCLHVGYAIYACRVDLQHSLLSAFARVTLWTAVLEICGFCNMTGPLGRNQSWLEPLWYRLTAGTLKQPLLPFLALPRRRGPADQLLFVLYLCSATAYYFPLLFCLAVGGEGSRPAGCAGCAGCQLAHLFMPGLCLGSQKFCCPFLLPRCLKEKRCS